MTLTDRATQLSTDVKRTGGWWIVTSLALLVVLVLAKQQVGVIIYKLLLIALAICLSYWADRVLFKNAPKISLDMPRDVLSASRLLTRALIAVAVVLGFALSL